MATFASDFSPRELEGINRCRLYQQVSSVADITTGNGYSSTQTAWQDDFDDTRPHYFSWPFQARPSATDQALWKQALQCLIAPNSSQRHLQQPLSPWTIQDEQWIWYLEPAYHRVYQRTRTTWNLWIPSHRRRQRNATPSYILSEEDIQPPPGLEPATVYRLGDTIRCTGSTTNYIDTTISTPPTTLQEYIDALPPDRRWSMEQVQMTDNGETIARALRQGTAIAVSDGSASGHQLGSSKPKMKTMRSEESISAQEDHKTKAPTAQNYRASTALSL